MSLALSLAIYFMIWWITLFAVLPIGVRTQDEEGAVIPGTPGSAPAKPRLLWIMGVNTLLASVVFLIVWLCATQGWIPLDLVFVSSRPS